MSGWDLLNEYLHSQFIRYAYIAGGLTALSASLIGVPLVLKRYSHIGDGLSHIAFGGIAIASVINLTNNDWIVIPLTIIVSILLLGRGPESKIKGDAAIAMLSVGSLALGYFLLSSFSPKANVSNEVCASLFGSIAILTLETSDIYLCIIMSLLVIGIYLLFYRQIFAVTFDYEFVKAVGGKARQYELLIALVIGIVVSLSMRLVGSLLTTALLIFPALSSMRIFNSFKNVIISSAIIGLVSALLGITTSIIFNTPVGATIVLVDVVIFMSFWGLSKVIKN